MRSIKVFGSEFIIYQIEGDRLTFRDAMASSKVKKWKDDVKNEINFFLASDT